MAQQKRNRPRISTTLSPYTYSVLLLVAKEQQFGKAGPTLDYIIADWIGLKRAAILAAAPAPTPEAA